MNEHEKLVAEIKTEMKDITEKMFNGYKKENEDGSKTIKADFEAINEKLAKLEGDSKSLLEVKESLDALNTAMKAQGDVLDGLKASKTKKGESQVDEFSVEMKQAFENAGFGFSVVDGVETISKGAAHMNNMISKNAPVQMKAAHVMGSSDVTGNAIPLDFMTMGTDIIPVNTNDHVTDFYDTKTTSEVKTMTLLIEYDLEGDLATTAEGVASGLISIKLKSKDFTIFDSSVMATIPWRQDMETPELMNAIRRLVPDKIKQYLDTKILSAGGDNSTEMWGAMNSENGTAFNALEYAGLGNAVANKVDLVTFMKNQCKTADYSANGIYMGDKQALSIAAIRDTTNNNIIDRRLGFTPDGDLSKVAGLIVKESRLLPSTLLVSVTNMNKIKFAKGMNVVVGFNADDLSKRRVSTVWSFLVGYGSQNVNANIFTNDIEGDLKIINELPATSLTRIDGYAVANDATALTTQMLINAGGTDVYSENLAGYITGVAGATGVATAAALQVIIDAAN